MNSRAVTLIAVAAGLVAAGWLLRPLAAGAAPATGRRAAGVAGVLGGLRTLAADLVWLRAHATWERRDGAETEALVELTTAIDPEPLYFWLNGARIIAYDLPAWRIAAAGGFAAVPAAERARIDEEQAQRALALLAKARAAHPRSAALWIEEGNLHLNRRHDVNAAAESYRRAAALPEAPYYAARIYAELLRRLGRKREALAWLTQLAPTLPADDPAAAADVVRARIRDLHRELGDAEATFGR